jgi:UDP-N-acetylmuramate--alanine ligase
LYMEKIRVGIFFGGASREREVSFAGGRTVYDNLDKNLFEPVPFFVDEFGNFVHLKWEYVYRGTIRDFYPPVEYLPNNCPYQLYSENLEIHPSERKGMLSKIGEVVSPDQLSSQIDVAFLALHGMKGEDGSIQGLLEWYGIPYTGSGVLPSAIGINKAVQKVWMEKWNFDGPEYFTFTKSEWGEDKEPFYEKALKIGFPLMVKAANQGSSVGIVKVDEPGRETFEAAVEHCLFRKVLTKSDWEKSDKVRFISTEADIRSGLGFPLLVDGELVRGPQNLESVLNRHFKDKAAVTLEAEKGEKELVIEKCIEGQEFSCIVLENQKGEGFALPPTEIVKSKAVFDYKSKYLPGLVRKQTPIHTTAENIQRIREACVDLYEALEFDTYARIDGFLTANGTIYLNDPNTTSGMMPSSFFFHQAAEIGLNPSQFLTLVLKMSVDARDRKHTGYRLTELKNQLDSLLKSNLKSASSKKQIGVIMGGYSTERHISVESGRNIYEKLASSPTYAPIPIFLVGNDQKHELFEIPINMMLKDNADDIRYKIEHFEENEILHQIRLESRSLTQDILLELPDPAPRELTYAELASRIDEAFIALHGRPGEDGVIQGKLEEVGIPYNGSSKQSSSITIDKFKTNNLLREAGFLVADNFLVHRTNWLENKATVLNELKEIKFPVIAKPSDEGCSSAVKLLRSTEELDAYAAIAFRDDLDIDPEKAKAIGLDPQEEFPAKDYFLVEECIDRRDADHFLEITGGMLTQYDAEGNLTYEVFEPSEALAEGSILSLAEKFLAGEGQNITPARYHRSQSINRNVSEHVRKVLEGVARTIGVEGYCRIDAFVRVYDHKDPEVIIIEINSLPGMTPATCIYHQAALNGYKPFDFIDKILTFGRVRKASA